MIAHTPAVRRYTRRVLALSVVYALVLVGAVSLFKYRPPAGVLGWLVAIAPGLPIVGIFAAIGRYIVEETDEYLRMQVTRQSLVATGFALSLATIWGFLEDFGLMPHIPAYHVAVVWFAGLGVGGCVNWWLERRGA
ncbi:hypothetical protein [uncultured Sphingomonas sp.]|uniref:hypothetical protein n=1 Tax=uncultured Sphingomonas sp. TaxID=158754 RepID=UPI0035CA2507